MKKFNFKVDFFEAVEKPTFHVGRRTAKTVIAVFLCAIVGYLRGTESAIFAMIAAINCIQPTRDESLVYAFNRVIGTVIGGVLGAVCLFLGRLTGIIDTLPIYYLIISIILIPVIQITLLLRKPSTTSFSCIVFLSVTVTRMGDLSPVAYAVERMVETLLGIGIGLAVNWIIPRSKKDRETAAIAAEASEGDGQIAPQTSEVTEEETKD